MDRFEAMQVFVRVAEAGSFTAVADQLNVARSAITRQVAALERRLGVKLMARSTRSLSLTPAGSAYLAECREILARVEAAEAGLSQERAMTGRIRMGLPLAFGLEHLMPALVDFARAHPSIDLQLDFSDQRANLVEEGMDLTVRITSELQPTDVARRLGRARLVTVASPAYLAAHGRPRQPAQLEGHDCLVYSMDPWGRRWGYGRGDKAQVVNVRARLVANNGEALMRATASGLGISRQPDFIAASYLASGQVVEILASHEPPSLGIFAVLPGNRFIPPRVRALIDHIEATLRARG